MNNSMNGSCGINWPDNKWQGKSDGWTINCFVVRLWHYQSDIKSRISMHWNVQPWRERYHDISIHFFPTSTAASQSQRERNRCPCVMSTRTKRSTFTASPMACPHARCVRYSELTKTARCRPSAAFTRQRRWWIPLKKRNKILVCQFVNMKYIIRSGLTFSCATSLPPPP